MLNFKKGDYMESKQSLLGSSLLPLEILNTICLYLPIVDQVRVVPNVCHIWRSICSKELQKSFQELAKEVLENQIIYLKNPHYSDEQIINIVELARKNNLISIIREQAGFCEIVGYCGNHSIILQKTNNQEDYGLECSTKDYNGYSNFLKVSWNLKDQHLLRKEPKKGDFRTSCSIEIRVQKFYHMQENIFKSFSLNVTPSFCFEKRKLLRWKKVTIEKIKPLKMVQLIEDAFNIELKMYVAFFTNINLQTISEKDISSLAKGTPLTYSFDTNGLITHSQDQDVSDKNYFKIMQKKINEELAVLVWESSDYDVSKEKDCDIKKVLRWSIFSSICNHLAEQTGLTVHKIL